MLKKRYKVLPKHPTTHKHLLSSTVTILPPKGSVKPSPSAPNQTVTAAPHTENSPVLIVWYAAEGRVEAVDVESHIALITHELFLWILFTSTDVASTDSARLVRVVLTSFTHRSNAACEQKETTAPFRLQKAPRCTGNGQRWHNCRRPGTLRPLILTETIRTSQGKTETHENHAALTFCWRSSEWASTAWLFYFIDFIH